VIRFAEIVVGEGTVIGCTRCLTESIEPTYRDVDEIVAEARAVCESWAGTAGPNIRLVGAEPFGHPQLPGVVSGVLAAGSQRLAVDTDAIALQSAGNASGALHAGVRHIRFTLLAGVDGLHDALAGAPGLLDATLEGVRSFRATAEAAGLDVSIVASVPVCRHNVHGLPSAVGVAVECGADRVDVRVTDDDVDLAAAVPWITAACDTGVVNGVWVEVAGVPFCLLPGYDLHLSDAVRPRAGAKQPVCGECALDALCGGAPEGASTDQLALLRPPDFAARLAPLVQRSRATEVR
jgi:hypothetical protein